MKKKSLAALLLAMAMILALLAGCGNAASSETPEPVQTEAPAPAQEPAPDEEPEPEPTEEPAGPEAYYACEETTEITMLFQYPGFFQGFFPNGWGASDFWTEFGEATNTIWELQEISNMAWTENVNLLSASGELPDVVVNIGNSYNGGLSAAIRDEIIIDIAPLIEENSPNYFHYVTQDDYTLKTTLTDEGEMGAMYPLTKEPDPITDGLWIRQDWLDELDMDIPNDPESLRTVLRAFADNFGADIGFFQMVRVGDSTIGPAAEGIWNAFGPVNYYLDDAGKIQASFMQDYYYEYLAYLQSLANEGLFLTSSMTDRKAPDMFASGSIGIEGDSVSNVPSYTALLSEEEQAKIKLVPMAALGEPTEFGEDQSLISGANSGGGNVSISTNCEKPEIVLKAFDYLYTEPGSILSIYGIEGQSYELDADGQPVLTDLVLNNPDGIPTNAALGYWCNPGIPGLGDAKRLESHFTDVQKSAAEVWASAYTGSSATVAVDSLALTREEKESISLYISDMKTYADEWINKVIFNNGDLSEAAIAEFRNHLIETQHLDEILKVYNAAYERFQNRSLKS